MRCDFENSVGVRMEGLGEAYWLTSYQHSNLALPSYPCDHPMAYTLQSITPHLHCGNCWHMLQMDFPASSLPLQPLHTTDHIAFSKNLL